MFNSLALVLLTLAGGEEGFTEPLADEKSPAEYGYGLSKEEALTGWIALFDGKTTFGWQDAKLEMNQNKAGSSRVLTAGTTTSPFHCYELRLNVVTAGTLQAGTAFSLPLKPGWQRVKCAHRLGQLQLKDGLAVGEFSLRPTQAVPLFNGKDLSGWRVLAYPKSRPDKTVSWKVQDGHIHALGGPGALEYHGAAKANGDVGTAPPLLQDFLLQADVRTAEAHTNGGIFLRNPPGTVMMGYETQLHNRVYDTRNGQGGCCTGSVDDRQHARKLVCRDCELFRLTTVIAGPHISIWVNGHQTCDWTDMREPNENPRRGLRLAGGTLQLQAHDPETNLEFHQLLLDRYETPK
ncbi:hypothetical protein ETAA8_02630 [Anatilimnocola aggregata]|uniref:3-keto-alpha-glucoside-1,2-lyase/3-keto-2-hydroxy-glucal hydratase domain-containing protein n=1 Tax=Anatilimnocola aggregata TaxID=2528021 RepID=A0A517Y4T7_9BACT|nr:DUF1080 domain-containing protein [Anatilimnocola aggregata]QDU25200.1 hypothetical protein ETAA8_02630 [Anatilimnocola aggregata]